jgi:hypothetical protein
VLIADRAPRRSAGYRVVEQRQNGPSSSGGHSRVGHRRRGRLVAHRDGLAERRQILWVNTQGIFAVGLALLGCYWLGATLALDPDQIDARFSLGFAYWSSDQREAAIREWREVLRRDPGNERVKQVLSRATGS